MKNLFLALLFFGLVLCLIVISMRTGSSDLGFSALLRFLKSTEGLPLLDDSQMYIFKELRFPRTMTALWVGASLGLAGFLLQTLLDNPLAEPYTLGLSGGATLGALSALVVPLVPLSIWLPIGALIGCAIVTLIILVILKRAAVFQSRALILFGIMISLFCGSLITLFLSLFEPSKLHTAVHWMMGHCGTDRDQWWPLVAASCLFAVVWTLSSAKSIDALLLGEDLAHSIGVPIKSLRIQIVLVVALLTATSVSLMGLVGFVGLLAPHISYLLTKSRRTKSSLALTVLSGAFLLLGADVLGRFLGGDSEVPAGSLVALIGAPFLMLLLLKRFRDV